MLGLITKALASIILSVSQAMSALNRRATLKGLEFCNYAEYAHDLEAECWIWRNPHESSSPSLAFPEAAGVPSGLRGDRREYLPSLSGAAARADALRLGAFVTRRPKVMITACSRSRFAAAAQWHGRSLERRIRCRHALRRLIRSTLCPGIG
jgi:hypothetical protein